MPWCWSHALRFDWRLQYGRQVNRRHSSPSILVAHLYTSVVSSNIKTTWKESERHNLCSSLITQYSYQLLTSLVPKSYPQQQHQCWFSFFPYSLIVLVRIPIPPPYCIEHVLHSSTGSRRIWEELSWLAEWKQSLGDEYTSSNTTLRKSTWTFERQSSREARLRFNLGYSDAADILLREKSFALESCLLVLCCLCKEHKVWSERIEIFIYTPPSSKRQPLYRILMLLPACIFLLL